METILQKPIEENPPWVKYASGNGCTNKTHT